MQAWGSQTSSRESRALLGEVLAGGAPQRVGWFRYYFDDDRWEWSPQVQRMHGYTPGTVTPTTDLVLSHKHPDDYRQIADTLALIRQTRQAFSTRHRIIDVQKQIHDVVVVGDQLHDDDDNVVGTHGYYVDLTPAEQARHEQITATVAKLTEYRAVIEQAKGMLMMIYGVDEPTALELLSWRSEEAGVKLRALAGQVVADFRLVSGGSVMPPRATYDNLLLTAHRRIK
jgi:fructose-specific component phosphotransferase system IIB-like protein